MSRIPQHEAANEPGKTTFEPTESTIEPGDSTNEPSRQPTNPRPINILIQRRIMPFSALWRLVEQPKNRKLPNEPRRRLRSGAVRDRIII